ncbi:MAG: LacI family DNA-binding transcriptional regulator [Asticcacaulis sp.]|nr:LacI family DNA-binding transcriptional regulator [Asticcacaulis sp.]
MATGKPTIDDVAARSGVARATVSRVLNGSVNVRSEVRARVMQTVDELGYRVNLQARALAGGKVRAVTLVYAADPEREPNSFYHYGRELGAMRACAEAGLNLTMQAVSDSLPDPVGAILARLDTCACAGVVLTPPFSDDVALIHQLIARNLPVACIAPGTQAQLIAAGVGMDEAQAGYDLTRHLLDLGHRRFAFIRGRASHTAAEARYSGFMRALAEAGIAGDSVVCERGNFAFRSGVERSAEILARPGRPTALICANDDMAAGALFTAHRLGLDIPGELSVAGFDDTPLSQIIWPPLTTVHQPLKVMGARAVEHIIAVLKTSQRGQDRPPVRFEAVPHKVVARQSAGPPPQR